MKHLTIHLSARNLFVFLMLTVASLANSKQDYAYHALTVHRLSYWAPEYLTVTNNFNNLFFSSAPSSLKTLSVITAINGESTKDMEPSDFYAIIDRSSSFSLTYMTKIRGENKTYTQTLNKKSGLLPYSIDTYYGNKFGSFFSSGELRSKTITKYDYWGNPQYDKVYGPSARECTSLMADQNVDFFQFCTFDYMVTDEDYTIDLGLVQALTKELEKKGMKFEPDNPDLHVYLTKNASANIESIYVPNIVSHTTSSSRTTGRMHIYYGNYNTWGRSTSSTSGSSSSSTSDIGSSQTIVDGDLYVQVTLLDAKKMDSARPPVVWQMLHQRHFTKEFNAIEKIKDLHAALYFYPLATTFNKSISSPGVFFKEELSKSGLVTDVADGSWAAENGIKAGFVLKNSCYEKVGKGKSVDFRCEVKFDKIKLSYMSGDELPIFFIPEEYVEDY